MRRIRIGLIGLGRHGMRYAQHLLHDIPEGELVAVCRRTPLEEPIFGAKSGITFYQDYRDLIQDSRVDAVVVVTPPARTREICLEAVHAQKPLLIEKPLAPFGRTAQDMVKAATVSGVPLMTAQTLRFDSAIQAFKRAISTVGTGQYLVLHLRLEPKQAAVAPETHNDGRGVMLELGIHLVDLVRYLTGDEVVEVQCRMGKKVAQGPESCAFATLYTSSGLICLLDVSRLGLGRVGRVEWIGQDGQLVGDWISHRLGKISGDNIWKEEEVPVRPTVQETLTSFISALIHKKPMPISGLDGQRAVEIVDACYQSAAQGSIPIVVSQE